MQRLIVSADRHETIQRRFSSEDGQWVYFPVHCHLVAFREPYGIEWTLCHSFPDSDAGASQARRVATQVQATLDAHGVEALDDTKWATRIIYGSDAYQDEEPWIVQREKEDALLSG
jgi:hypothetical protein